MPVTTPAVTTTWRFGMAFGMAAVASAGLPYAVTPIIIAATGRREAGMAIGVPAGIMLGWLLFPFLAWRPVRAIHLLALPLAVLFVVAGFTLLPQHWLTSRESDRNGLQGTILNVTLCALAGYGALTWVRNLSLRAGAP